MIYRYFTPHWIIHLLYLSELASFQTLTFYTCILVYIQSMEYIRYWSILWTMPSYQNIISLLIVMNCWYVDMYDDISSQGVTQFSTNYSKNGLVRLREIFTPGTLKVPKSHTALKELESIHKVLDLYVWLSYRLEESFADRELASSQKAICSLLIEEFLERFGWQRPRTKRLTQNSRLTLISQETRHKF